MTQDILTGLVALFAVTTASATVLEEGFRQALDSGGPEAAIAYFDTQTATDEWDADDWAGLMNRALLESRNISLRGEIMRRPEFAGLLLALSERDPDSSAWSRLLMRPIPAGFPWGEFDTEASQRMARNLAAIARDARRSAFTPSEADAARLAEVDEATRQSFEVAQQEQWQESFDTFQRELTHLLYLNTHNPATVEIILSVLQDLIDDRLPRYPLNRLRFVDSKESVLALYGVNSPANTGDRILQFRNFATLYFQALEHELARTGHGFANAQSLSYLQSEPSYLIDAAERSFPEPEFSHLIGEELHLEALENRYDQAVDGGEHWSLIKPWLAEAICGCLSLIVASPSSEETPPYNPDGEGLHPLNRVVLVELGRHLIGYEDSRTGAPKERRPDEVLLSFFATARGFPYAGSWASSTDEDGKQKTMVLLESPIGVTLYLDTFDSTDSIPLRPLHVDSPHWAEFGIIDAGSWLADLDLDRAVLLSHYVGDKWVTNFIGENSLPDDLRQQLAVIRSTAATIALSDVNRRTVQNALELAEAGEFSGIEYLIQEDDPAIVSANRGAGRTALHSAVAHGNFDITAWLIEAGADVNAATREGSTPLYEAILQYTQSKQGSESQLKIIATLVDNGATIGDAILPPDIANNFPQLMAILERQKAL